MVSNGWPSKSAESSIKCWWIPLEAQSFDPKRSLLKKDDSLSSENNSAQFETRSPINGLTTGKLVSAVAGLWDYVGDPTVLKTKESLKYHKVCQKENLICFSDRQSKLKSTPSEIESLSDGLRSGRTLSSQIKSNLEELKAIKKRLLFASCSKDLANSDTWKYVQVTCSHSHLDSNVNDKSEETGAPCDLANLFEVIDGKSEGRDLTEFTNYDSNITSRNGIKCEKNYPTDVSISQATGSSIIVESKDASSDKTLCSVENCTQSPSSLHSSYSVHPITSSKDAIVVLKNPDLDMHLGYHTEFMNSTDITSARHQKIPFSGSLVAKCSSQISNSEDDNIHEIEKRLFHELNFENGNYRKHWLSLSHKIQDVFAKNRYAIAGALAGTSVTLCLHPVDTVKTIIQADGMGSSSCYMLRRIIYEKGIFGLYRGIASNIASSAPISAIYTYTYESVKGVLLPLFSKEHHSFAHCIAGGCASIATSIIFTPSERIKQQMQVGLQYRNCWSALIGCLEKGGLPSLYTGWWAVLCRNIPHSIIKFYTYESLKQLLLTTTRHDGGLSTLQTLICGGIAGSTAALFTTPFDVVKTRLQTQAPGTMGKYDNVFHALQEIFRKEGLRGLYRGLTPRLAMYVSQGAIFFASYEFLKAVFALEVPRSLVLVFPNKQKAEETSSPRVN